MAKRIAIGCDHGGTDLKNIVISYLEKKGYTIVNFGTDSTESVDYPDYAVPVCEAVKSGECDCGILICGTGIGMSIAANKIKGIRAAHCTDTFSARFTRLHNDANVLCMGARITGPGLALDIVDLFLETGFEGGRHSNRLEKIAQIEKNN